MSDRFTREEGTARRAAAWALFERDRRLWQYEAALRLYIHEVPLGVAIATAMAIADEVDVCERDGLDMAALQVRLLAFKAEVDSARIKEE